MSETDHTSDDPRVWMALERTFLAWTRTALALMGLGFVVARIGLFLREIAAAQIAPTLAVGAGFANETSHSFWIGGGLIVLGTLVQTLALAQHVIVGRHLKAGQPVRPINWSLPHLLGFGMIALGIGLGAYLVELF